MQKKKCHRESQLILIPNIKIAKLKAYIELEIMGSLTNKVELPF